MISEEELALVFQAEKIAKKAKEILLSQANKENFAKDKILPYEEGICFFYVKRGTVSVLSEGENGGEYYLYNRKKDEGCVVVPSLKYKFNSSCELILLNEECYVAAQNGGASAYFLEIARTQEEKLIEKFNSVMFQSVNRRLTSFLLEASAKVRSPILSLTHEQIAIAIGTDREVVTRKIAFLKEEGALDSSRGKIILKNKDLLKKKK